MKKIFFVIGIALLVQGCVPAAFVAGAAAGAGAVIYDQRSTGTIVDDRNIIFKVQNKIDDDVDLKSKTSISATAFNHIVLLVGQAPAPELRSRAENLAKEVSGVKIIYNEISIEKPISKSDEANDSWITAKVKTSLMAESGLSSSQMKIVTENGVVYLMGLTTRSQAQIAAEKASTVTGVKKVIKLFEYEN